MSANPDVLTIVQTGRVGRRDEADRDPVLVDGLEGVLIICADRPASGEEQQRRDEQ